MTENVDKDLEEFWSGASPETLQRMMDLAQRALKAAGSVLSSFSGDRHFVRCGAGLRPVADCFPISDTLCGQPFATSIPFAASAATEDWEKKTDASPQPIEAYLGVPVRIASGGVIGTLCVVDTRPHDWSEDDKDLLVELAACLTHQIELRREVLLRREAEEALRASQARLLAVADNIPGLVFERRKIAIDRSTYTFFGSKKAQLPAVREMMKSGAGGLRFIHRDDRESVRSGLLRSTMEEADLDLTFRVKDVDGTLRSLRSQSVVRRDADGGVFWDGLCFDITDLVAAQEEAESARAEKEAAFVNVNHELRTPLQAIIGFTEFLKTERRPNFVAAHAQNIQSAAKAVLAIVNDTLDRAGRASAPEVVDIRGFAEACLSLVGPQALKKHLTAELAIEKTLPQTILFDRKKVQQALLNLLNNAVKFTDTGSFTLTVKRAASGLRFGVVDTGIGIPLEKRDLLFRRFSRLEANARTTDGTGLGLSITKQLVESMNGRIGIAANRGPGTTFWFEIPFLSRPTVAPSYAPAFVPSRPDIMADAKSASRPARILVADDLDLNRKLIADMLSLDDHIVDCVADGAAAEKAASEGTYDLILMDMIMPGTDGLAATQAIRTLPKPACDVPIVALTANSFREQLDKCLAAGMDATLTKPMSLDTLAATVTTWAQKRKAA